jgi:hypothetical protein
VSARRYTNQVASLSPSDILSTVSESLLDILAEFDDKERELTLAKFKERFSERLSKLGMTQDELAKMETATATKLLRLEDFNSASLDEDLRLARLNIVLHWTSERRRSEVKKKNDPDFLDRPFLDCELSAIDRVARDQRFDNLNSRLNKQAAWESFLLSNELWAADRIHDLDGLQSVNEDYRLSEIAFPLDILVSASDWKFMAKQLAEETLNTEVFKKIPQTLIDPSTKEKGKKRAGQFLDEA